MPLVTVLIRKAKTLPAETNADDVVVVAERAFVSDLRYSVTQRDAETLITAGDAVAIDVPRQDGLPYGSMDSLRLLNAMKALEPKAPPVPVPAPSPIVDTVKES